MALASFLIVTISTLIVFGLSNNKFMDNPRIKTKIYVFLLMFYLYSGFNIYKYDNNIAISMSYVLFLFSFYFGFCFVNPNLSGKQYASWVDPTIRELRQIINLLAWVYFAVIIFRLVYPDFKILRLFDISYVFSLGLRTGSVFQMRINRSANVLLSLANYISILTMPFFYIYLYQKKVSLAKFTTIIVFVLYCDSLASGEWGRGVLVMPLLYMFFYLLYTGEFRKKHLVIFGLIFLALLFIIYILGVWRSGSALNSGVGVLKSVQLLLEQEFSYPRLYNTCIELHNIGGHEQSFFKWLFTMPLPSALINNDYLVSRDLSSYLLGLSYGSAGYYIILPSWLGEALYTFGKYGVWIAGLVVGIITGLFTKTFEKNQTLLLFDIYFTVTLTIYLRSSFIEFLAQTVQTIWILLFLVIIFTLLRQRRQRGLKSRSWF